MTMRLADLTISEERGVRYLHFGNEWIQGAMRIGRPLTLELDYVRSMMAWLLFLEPPGAMLQLGLGAAALTKFCHHHFAQTSVTAVEIAQPVIDLARTAFALPADDDRLKVVRADAAAFVASRRQHRRYGVVQVDLYDREAAGPVHDSRSFYEDCRRALHETAGVMIVNLFGRHRSFGPSLARIAAAFSERLLLLPPNAQGNTVVLAFSGPPLSVPLARLRTRAALLERRLRLPAGQWVDGLRVYPAAPRGQAPASVLVV
jgi:spermidine synthase